MNDNYEMIAVALILTNVVLMVFLLAGIHENNKMIKEWKDFAMFQYDRQNHLFKWLCNNLSDYGDFGQGDEPNVISFNKRKR